MLLKKALSFFSYFFHPVFVSVYAAFLYMWLDLNSFTDGQKYLIVLQIALITLFIPMIFFLLLGVSGKADSLMLKDVSQRRIPLAFNALMLYILITRSITADAISELHYFLFGGLISTILALALVVLLKFKASLHMLGISSLTAFAFGLSYHNQRYAIPFLAILVLCNGLVASSRLSANAHSNRELIVGFLCGLIPQLILWKLWL